MAGILGDSTCSRGKSPTFIYRWSFPPGILYTAVFDCQKLLFLPLSTPNANMLPWEAFFLYGTLFYFNFSFTIVHLCVWGSVFLWFSCHLFIYRNSHFIHSSHFFGFSENEFSTSQGLFMVFPGFPHLKQNCQRAFLPLDDFFSVAAGRGMDGFYNDKARLWDAGGKKGQKHWGFWVIFRDFKNILRDLKVWDDFWYLFDDFSWF